MASKLDLCYNNLQTIGDDFGLKGISIDCFTPDFQCISSSNWNLSFFTHKPKKRWYRNGPKGTEKRKRMRDKQLESQERKQKHDEFPVVVVIPTENENDYEIPSKAREQ